MHEKDVNQLDWAEIVQKLYHQTHKQTSVTQVQALYKKFRDQTNQFMDLLKVVGYEWNPNNNNVTCNDEVWEHIYWVSLKLYLYIYIYIHTHIVYTMVV